jgi:hypothetical protein
LLVLSEVNIFLVYTNHTQIHCRQSVKAANKAAAVKL